jgi:hypothetical protein
VRILVTGSRDWPYQEVVWQELARSVAFLRQGHGDVTIVDGACPSGADNMAHGWVEHLHSLGAASHIASERHPANWTQDGKAAGVIRNQRMVNLGADLCLAFRFNLSRGTTDCLHRAAWAGIPCCLIDLSIGDYKRERV